MITICCRVYQDSTVLDQEQVLHTNVMHCEVIGTGRRYTPIKGIAETIKGS